MGQPLRLSEIFDNVVDARNVSWFVLVQTRKQADALKDTLQVFDVECHFVTTSSPPETSSRHLHRFAHGYFPVLITFPSFITGWRKEWETRNALNFVHNMHLNLGVREQALSRFTRQGGYMPVARELKHTDDF